MIFLLSSMAVAAPEDVFSRLLLENNHSSIQFLSQKKIGLGWNTAIDSKYSHTVSMFQMSIYPIAPMEITVGLPIWLQEGSSLDTYLYGRYIVIGDEERWNISVANGVFLSESDGKIFSPSVMADFVSRQSRFHSTMTMGSIWASNYSNSGLNIEGMAGVQFQNTLYFFELNRMSLSGINQNRVSVGTQIYRDSLMLNLRLSNPALQNVQWTSLRYSVAVEYKLLEESIWSDIDGDGIFSSKDKCPNSKEDLDGFKDEDGCPDIDNDSDKISDTEDQCPDLAEDYDDFQDEDGCPEFDNDNDGLPDDSDRCPDEAESFNSFKDEDGCPELRSQLDYDSDGYQNHKDRCPLDAEDFDGFKDEDGCPEIDNDHDGLLDEEDPTPI